MGENIDLRRGLAAAASLSVIAGLLSACSPGPGEPAPVYLRSASPTVAKASPPPPWRDNTIFTVRQGDTVIDIAHDNHVPLGALIAANKLRSPYLIHPGDQMLIPDGGVPPQMAAMPPRPGPSMAPPQTIATLPLPPPAQVAAASPPPASQVTATPLTPPPAPPAQIAVNTLPPTPPPPPAQIAAAAPPSAAAQIAAITPHPPPLPQMPGTQQHPTAPVQAVTAQLQPAPNPVVATATPTPPPSPQPQIVAAATPAPPQSPPPMPAKVTADVMPLDPPPKQLAALAPVPPAVAPPAATTSAGLPSVLAARNPAAALPLPGEPAPIVAIGTANSRFLWPVHGRILASYGLANGGPRNEGINIAAPLGTPVRTIDAGTVAYVGNEVKGYGNLVLVRHANGWISAYAYLDDVTVRKGDTVSAGEVIAKVGDTGGVGEPQLHFELRRGKKPVDPKEFLEPAGSAAAKSAQKAG